MGDRLKVVVADPMHEAGMELLREHFDVDSLPVARKDLDPACLHQADAVIVRTFKLPAVLLEKCEKLKAIVKHGAGVDNIDIDAATARGIQVANTGDANAESVAELAVTLMMAASRRTVAMHRAVTDGNYDIRWSLLLESICGKTLGIVGFGNIGRRVAAMCRNGFNMRVIAFDPYLTAEQVRGHGAEKVDSIEQLLGQADIISLHSGLSEDSKYLIGKTEIARMKSSAVLINTARGGVVDEHALAAALAAGKIYGAGIDVYEDEPPKPGHPLFQLDNVVLSPHVGGATVASRRLMATRAAEAVTAILGGAEPQFWLNRRGMQ